jgi:hypothetical protein
MHKDETLERTAVRQASLRQNELREAIAIALASFALDSEKGSAAKDVCRRLENALLASGAGPLALGLLETLDARLREALGDHDLLEGRYA